MSNKLEVVFFPERTIKEAASRYRAYSLAEKLQKYMNTKIVESPLNHSLKYATYSQFKKLILNLINNFKMFSNLLLRKESVFVFQRGQWQKGRYQQINFFRKLANRNMIFDIDDAIFLQDNNVDKIFSLCDVIFAGSHFIKDYAENFNSNIYLIPTSIDTQKYQIKEHKEKEEVTIGWVGSPSTIKYLSILKDPLERLGDTYSIKFVVVGANNAEDNVPKIKNIKTEIKDWSLETEWDEISLFDIGVMPQFNGGWEKGKCAFKAIQYMVLGIPAVCSSVGEANYLIDNGFDGFLCNNEDDWISNLEKLIIDHNLRDKIGRKGRRKIEEEYDVSKTAKKVSEIIKSEFGDNS